MNNANQISHHTKLYGFIGESAGQSSLSARLNKIFKANNKDAMMIPMNIREDDLYFTVANMKKSHVNGAVISNEYVSSVVEILDESSDIVEKSGMCDILLRDGEKLVGDIFSIDVLVDFLKTKNVKKMALIGVNPHAKAFTLSNSEFEISYFYDDLEKLMNFTQEMQIQDADINRIAENIDTDFSSFDAVLDFSDMDDFSSIKKFSALNIDMKNKTEFSALKHRVAELGSEHIGFDDLLQGLCEGVYAFYEDKKHLEYDKSEMRF